MSDKLKEKIWNDQYVDFADLYFSPSGVSERRTAVLNDIKVYGEENEIDKQKCINHVNKRMSTGEKIGGRGGPTDEIIVQLSSYYENAIKDYGHDIKQMHNEIWAGFFSHHQFR